MNGLSLLFLLGHIHLIQCRNEVVGIETLPVLARTAHCVISYLNAIGLATLQVHVILIHVTKYRHAGLLAHKPDF